MFRRQTEILPKVPAVVGFVPEELRESFSSVLPVHDKIAQSRLYGVSWIGDKNPTTELLHPDVRHLTPVIELAINAGGLVLSPKNLIIVNIRQDDVNVIGAETGGILHKDRNEGAPQYYRRRLVVSDVYGLQYENDDGELVPTPDFGMLIFDDLTKHSAQMPGVEAVRTRLQITQI